MTLPESRRIGGEFELDPADLAPAAENPPLPSFGLPHEAWLDTGRSALALIARRLASGEARPTVWLPAFGCESLVAPFTLNGLALRFYATGARLDRVGAEPRAGDALLFIHYFGRLHREALERAARWRSASVTVIEDCVQAPLTDGVGRAGDYVLNSWRKLLPQPDGALLGARAPLDDSLDPPDEAFVSARSAGKLLRGAGADASQFLPLFDESEARLEANRPRAMSWLSRRLLGAADLTAVAERRVANERVLRSALRMLPAGAGIAPLQIDPAAGEVPLGCVVTVDGGRRDALRRHLAANDIYCPVHWDLSHVPAGFDQEQELASRVLTLPVDQRCDERDMQRIVDVLSTFRRDRP